jgi:DNA topoisomerase-3
MVSRSVVKSTMTIAVLAEKPSVARDIARVLGANQRRKGVLYGGGYVVTWAVGHLVTLAQPHEIQPQWKSWRRERLPMLPREWPLVVPEGTREQFELVKKVLLSPKVERVVCATDAGREGELIFRYIYQAAGCAKPVERLWISSLTAEAIRRGFRNLRPGGDYDPLADAARGRSQADWLVGMNLSRACTLAYTERGEEVLSVGRVQTPTLALVAARELEIRDFVPEEYFEVVATFKPEVSEEESPGNLTPGDPETYRGTWFRGKTSTSKSRRLPKDGEKARAIVERAKAGEAEIESIGARDRRMPAPFLYDLTELQRHGNRLWGWSAKKTLQVAQKLYEQRKLITYPRTDSRHLSKDVAQGLGKVVEAIRGPYENLLAEGSGIRPLSRRFVNDAKVSDHHAIIPTATAADGLALSADEHRLYDLICRRLLAAWHGDHVWQVTTVTTRIVNEGEDGPVIDRFQSQGNQVKEVGWKVLDLGYGKSGKSAHGAPHAAKRKGQGKKKQGEDEESQDLPRSLVAGQAQEVIDAAAVAKQTRPPKRLTEATLLTAMETAGKALDDKELSDAMREKGLGTPATRAEIIETLLRRKYIERMGGKSKALLATERGIRLIDLVHPHVKSPAMTGEWEASLKGIERGQGDLETFMGRIEDYVREVVDGVFGDQPALQAEPRSALPSTPAVPAAVPTSSAPQVGSLPPGNDAVPAIHAASSAPSQHTVDDPFENDWFDADSFDEMAYGVESGGSHGQAEPSDFDPSWLSPPLGSEPPEHQRSAPRSGPAAAVQTSTSPGQASLNFGAPQAPAPSARAARGRSHIVSNGASSGVSNGVSSVVPRRQPTPPEELGRLLTGVFGWNAFRPFQEHTCRTITEGHDVLLVMPTGAGKSLCYQLPGLARAGTTLVISPLIALMEDQVAKLQQLGLRAERVHSGRDRGATRRVYD